MRKRVREGRTKGRKRDWREREREREREGERERERERDDVHFWKWLLRN